jgi:hypothetical protein
VSLPKLIDHAFIRIVEMPDSPPKTVIHVGASVNSSSASARVTMAKYTPVRCVASQPKPTPHTKPAAAPASGSRGVGQAIRLCSTALIRCSVAKAPRP